MYILKQTKKVLLTGLAFIFLLTNGYAQVQIIKESFGSNTYQGDPSDYPDYTSDALFGGDSPHLYQAPASSGYEQASGGAAVLMGNWNDPANTTFVLQVNTSEYTSVRLSFGIKHNSGGWGTCQLTNNFTEIEYSTDSSSWNTMDKSALVEGSSWPCADEDIWSFVELSETLPSHQTLNIRFTHSDPDIHPYFLDDIILTGFSPDNAPPTTPSNLQVANVSANGCVISWNASVDNNEIGYYQILKDGYDFLRVKDTITEIKYQKSGSNPSFSVIAFDIADNASSESSPVSVSFDSLPVDHEYSWEKQQAKILPGGDLLWAPDSFVFSTGPSLRYIDYENGDDKNNGLSKLTPWKHHPWDGNATDNAANCTGIHTYVFKRGVIYRGTLTAKESGSPLEPIRLTSDPDWGDGEAGLYGSRQFSDGWIQADASTAPDIPDPGKVWYQDVWLPETKIICEIKEKEIKAIHLARSPNYRYTPDDPLESWWEWTGKTEEDGDLWLTDENNLIQSDPAYYDGATVFSQEDVIVMCTVWAQDVLEWDPDHNRIKVNNTNFGGIRSRYFIENTPFLLDTTSEFYYDQDLQRLYIRLEGNRDPNTAVIEVAKETQLINIEDKHHIEISGLTFGFTTAHGVHYGEEDVKSTIRMTGICHDIDIKNNKFVYLNGGVSLNSAGSPEVNSHSITVKDNEFIHMGDHTIVFSTSSGVYLDNIHILRNKIYNSGYRHLGRWYSSIPAIYGQLNYGEVAGNIIDMSWGNGIDMFWGKGGSQNRYVPFVRGLIHQNKASNTLIGTNDYGGIESWQGGPTYCYNNYSHNASGYKHYNNSSIGYAYYFDGSFKHIVFNNIASGVSHNRNNASIMQVLGFYNMYVHNTAYNTRTFFNAASNTLELNGHNAYLSNVGENVENFFRHQIKPEYIPFESYAYNLSSNSPFQGSIENKSNMLNLDEFISVLTDYNTQKTQTGWNALKTVLSGASSTNFAPLQESEAIDRGVKFFTAFPLSRVVGEWNFYKHPTDLSTIMGENFYFTEEFDDRTTYKDIPKNHLTAHNVHDTSFIHGHLEDWTQGALQFDGASVYCSISHEETNQLRCNNVDMEHNDFIIELYLQTEPDHTNGVLVSKYDQTQGYELGITGDGFLRMTLYQDGTTAINKNSAISINDGQWHHILVEVQRSADIDIYIDGKNSDGSTSGNMPEKTSSLSNASNLLIGKDNNNNFFSGAIDFLRISKAALYEAKTTIDELYKWETDGPFLYDMRGHASMGKRDAGALETGEKTCDLVISSDSLKFEEAESSKIIEVTESEGFEVYEISGEFYTSHISGDTVVVAVNENYSADTRKGTIALFGCNETRFVEIIQNGAPCQFEVNTDTIRLSSDVNYITIPVSTNGSFEVTSSERFVKPEIVEPGDSVYFRAYANPYEESRFAELIINGCAGEYTIIIAQEGKPTSSPVLQNNGVIIYPNPVQDNILNIQLSGDKGKYTFKLTDLYGKVVQIKDIYDVSGAIKLQVPAGIYVASLTSKDVHYKTIIVVQ